MVFALGPQFHVSHVSGDALVAKSWFIVFRHLSEEFSNQFIFALKWFLLVLDFTHIPDACHQFFLTNLVLCKSV